MKNPFFFFPQDGNPFSPFWDYVGVDFDKSVLFGGISFGAYHQLQWMKKLVEPCSSCVSEDEIRLNSNETARAHDVDKSMRSSLQ